MSSFTKPLTVRKRLDGLWEVARTFRYYVGKEGSNDYIDVPEGFKTDFASVPRVFWVILPPDGKYTQAAVTHDFLYSTQQRTRKKSDQIFFEAMEVLGVPWWKRKVMWRAVRSFGWIPWNKKEERVYAKRKEAETKLAEPVDSDSTDDDVQNSAWKKVKRWYESK